ncbi:hypothetical protein BKI52_34100 [marine bacterium AO1-C]|nr:hypothetical protein BKI52_34100 [marine bacterium AO1-C]
MKQWIAWSILIVVVGACQAQTRWLKTKGQKVLGGGVKHFSNKEIDDILQQYIQATEREALPRFLLNGVIIKKYRGGRVGLFTLSPNAAIHGVSHYAKVLKFADTSIVNFNRYHHTKNILPPSHMFGAMRYFKQLYRDQFTSQELKKIESSFYKGVTKRRVSRRYYWQSEDL